jgi:hypothetical protein
MLTEAVPDIVMLVGEMLVPLKADGALIASETVPVKPPTPATVTVEVPVLPWMMVTGVCTVSVKSWTLTVTFAVWDSDPLIPVTVTM